MTASDSNETSPPDKEPPRAWKFFGTLIWGVLVFAGLSLGQLAVLVYSLATQHGAPDSATVAAMLSSGRTIALSIIAGLPGALLVLWIAIRLTRISFADYLGLTTFSWKYLLVGVVGLAMLSQGWDIVGRAIGHEVSPGFMGDTLKTARADNAIWLVLVSFGVAAPLIEELMSRGFMYRGWSESFLRPVGAIVLSAAVWTAMHVQYDAFFLAQVFAIGLLFGTLRYLGGSTWVTIMLHGLNNLVATLQTMWLFGQPS
jgi:membrane protease YdiL (CAAX protease family)